MFPPLGLALGLLLASLPTFLFPQAALAQCTGVVGVGMQCNCVVTGSTCNCSNYNSPNYFPSQCITGQCADVGSYTTDGCEGGNSILVDQCCQSGGNGRNVRNDDANSDGECTTTADCCFGYCWNPTTHANAGICCNWLGEDAQTCEPGSQRTCGVGGGPPTGLTGQSCTANNQCATNRCDIGGTGTCCFAPGQPCLGNYTGTTINFGCCTGPSQYTPSEVCAVRSSNNPSGIIQGNCCATGGNTCSTTTDCCNGLLCTSGKCTPGGLGTPCQADSDCIATYMCGPGNQCTPLVKHTQGQSCYLNSDCSTTDGKPTYCNQGLCQYQWTATGSCTNTLDCAPGWQCEPPLIVLPPLPPNDPGSCCALPGTTPDNGNLAHCCGSLWLEANGTCGCSPWLGSCGNNTGPDCCTNGAKNPAGTITYNYPNGFSSLTCYANTVCIGE
jgi:hypothetical protein